MKLKLTRPLCFFDLETTGVKIASDRIVEMAVLKLHPSGEKEEKVWRVNPECPIPAQASAVHGIYDKDVAASTLVLSLFKRHCFPTARTELGLEETDFIIL